MVNSRRSPVPWEEKYHLGYPSGLRGGSAGGCGPPVPGGEALGTAASFFATLGAGSPVDVVDVAVVFVGGPLGEVEVLPEGGAL